MGGELREEGILFYFILNAYWESLEFELPKLNDGNSWRRWVDTSLPSPADIVPWEQAPAIAIETYRVADRSVVLLYANS